MRQATDSLQAASETGHLRLGTVVAGRFHIDLELPSEGGTQVYDVTDRNPADAGGGPAAWAMRVIPLAKIAGAPELLLASLTRIQFLRHKNLFDIEAVGREADFVFVVTERLDGKTLRAFMDAKRAGGVGVSLKGATNLVAHVANALEHARPLTAHGALNPSLIGVSRSGRVKVGGLGLAIGVPSLTRLGVPAGFPGGLYLAPEIIAGGAPTSTGDVYSMGAIFYELLTGQGLLLPYRAASTLVSALAPEVDTIVERAVSADPAHRWPSPEAFKLALQSAAAAAASVNANGSGGPQQPSVAGADDANPVFFDTGQTGIPEAAVPRPPEPVVTPPPPVMLAPVQAAPAVSASDESEERWLVQKGNLDFGPFSMVQIRAQIERGEILADHTILDNDSGDRCLVRDFPGLGGLVTNAHRRLEHARREHAERRSENTQKKKSLVMTAIVTLVVAAVIGGGAFYVLSRKDTSGGRLASREEEAEVESFLKGVKIGGMKATVRRGSHHVAGAPSGGPGDEFNNDARFGDASRGLALGDQTLDDDQIQSTMMANYRKLIPCIAHAPGMSEIGLDFVVRGTGKVSAVRVNGQRSGALPSCMLARFQSFSFPKFDGPKTIANWSMSLGR
jgi:hypothetical protein